MAEGFAVAGPFEAPPAARAAAGVSTRGSGSHFGQPSGAFDSTRMRIVPIGTHPSMRIHDEAKCGKWISERLRPAAAQW